MSVNDKSFTRAFVKKLCDHILEKVSGFKAVHDEFPSANQKLELPCASVSLQPVTFVAGLPYELSKGSVPDVGEGAPPARVVYSIGQFEVRGQIDVWCGFKIQRHTFHNAVLHAMNPGIGGALNLVLTDYYNQIVGVDLLNSNYEDSEIGAQRGEWRVRMEFQANCRAVKVEDSYLMETIENNLEIVQDQIID